MLKILVAEDRPENRLLIEVYLQGATAVLTFVEDGAAAVEHFQASDFDLILMDVRMPVMDGLAATRAIRAIERERGAEAIPIIALTAGDWNEDISRAGCTKHLSKPFSMPELIDAIRAHLRHIRRQACPPDAAGVAPFTLDTPRI